MWSSASLAILHNEALQLVSNAAEMAPRWFAAVARQKHSSLAITWHAVISGACRYPMPADRWPERGTSHLPLGRQSLGTRCQHSSRQLWCRGMPGQSGWRGDRKRWRGRVTHIMRLGCERATDLWYMPESLWGCCVEYQYCVYILWGLCLCLTQIHLHV